MPIVRVTPILNVASIPVSLRWFESLGWQRSFSWNSKGPIAKAADANEHGEADFAGARVGEVDVFFSQTPGHQRRDVTFLSWWMSSTAEVDELYKRAKELSYRIVREPFDAPWGVREFHLQHPDGHVMRVGAELPCD
jgi:uncharacterized glyoxalase superfamily protein PhnB